MIKFFEGLLLVLLGVAIQLVQHGNGVDLFGLDIITWALGTMGLIKVVLWARLDVEDAEGEK